MFNLDSKKLFYLDFILLFSTVVFFIFFFQPIALVSILIIRCTINLNKFVFIKFISLIIIIKFLFYMSLEVEYNYLSYQFINFYLIIYFFQFADYFYRPKKIFDLDISNNLTNILIAFFVIKVQSLWVIELTLNINLFNLNFFGQLYKFLIYTSFFYITLISKKAQKRQRLIIFINILFLILFIYKYSYSRYEILAIMLFVLYLTRLKLSLKLTLALPILFFCLFFIKYLSTDIKNFTFSVYYQYSTTPFGYLISFLDSIYTKLNYFQYYEMFLGQSTNVAMYYDYLYNNKIDFAGSVFDIGFITELFLFSNDYYFFLLIFFFLIILIFQMIVDRYIIFNKSIYFYILFYLYPFVDSIVFKLNTTILVVSFIVLIILISNKLKFKLLI